MQISIEYQTGHLDRIMDAVRHEIATPDEMLASIGEALLRVNDDRHEKGQAPDGTPWKPLSPLTIAGDALRDQQKSKRSSGATMQRSGSRRILYRNGDLLRFYYQVMGHELHLGTNDQKAVWNHLGTGTFGPQGHPYVIKPVNKKALAFAGMVRKRVIHPGIPARSLVGYPESDEQLVEVVCMDHLTTALKSFR